MNVSVPVQNTMEVIWQTEVSPLVSRCKIKVLYVGQEPNRNGTVISKGVAAEMGKYLPGSPIVGFFNQETQDFDGHNREIQVNGGQKFEIKDVTRPYGFVPPEAQVWFEKFMDGDVEHEYLCTEGYLWTGAYPEAQRVIGKGNNQSMELTNESGNWADDVNSGDRIFIYNEALIEKLCILGENVEPCFEGAQITAYDLDTSLMDDLRTHMFSMFSNVLQEVVKNSKGGFSGMDNEAKMAPTAEEQTPVEPDYKKKDDEEEGKSNQETQDDSQDNKEEKKSDEDEGKKKKYDLAEVTEYQELNAQYKELNDKYQALQNQYNALEAEKKNLETANTDLKTYKLETERKEKQAMINSFYMLSEQDKADVVANIDTYSLSDIEAKLSVICVRNKLNLSDSASEQAPATTFSLEAAAQQASDDSPEWAKAVRERMKNNS